MAEYTAYIAVDPQLAGDIREVMTPHTNNPHPRHNDNISRTVMFDHREDMEAWIGCEGLNSADGETCSPHAMMRLILYTGGRGICVANSPQKNDFYGEWVVQYEGDTYRVIVSEVTGYLDTETEDRKIVRATLNEMAKKISDLTDVDEIHEISERMTYLIMNADSDIWYAESVKYGISRQ